MLGELLCEMKGKVGKVIEIGQTLEGARFDIPVSWRIEGPNIRGKMETVDYYTARADGVGVVDARGIITTDDGEIIAEKHSGYAIKTEQENIYSVAGTATYLTASKKYEKLNRTIAVFDGTYNGKTGELDIKSYEWK